MESAKSRTFEAFRSSPIEAYRQPARMRRHTRWGGVFSDNAPGAKAIHVTLDIGNFSKQHRD
jgi:hypothetical protein